MKSVSTTFLEGFDITPQYRPIGTEQIIIGLLSTLAKHGYLEEAVGLIEENTDYVFTGSLAGISEVASTDVIPFLHKVPIAITVYLHLLPYLDSTEEYVHVPYTYEKDKRHIMTAVDHLNSLNLPFKVCLMSRGTDLLIINATQKDKILEIVQPLNLPMPTLDRIMTSLIEH